jgi:hypothetical protein
VVNVTRPPCGERAVRARRPLRLVIPLRDGGLSGRSGLGKESEGEKCSYVLESAGESCRVEPA